jgi:hypothetical protein
MAGLTVRLIVTLAVFLTAAGARTCLSQVLSPSSATYLFTSNIEDARTLWINPAGLGILPMASLYAELGADRSTDAWELRQYTFGMSSRGAAVSYQRDRFPTGNPSGRWRVGMALPLAPRMAVGASVTFYRPDRGADVGLRFSPMRLWDFGFVLRNIGRPDVNGSALPVTAAMGGTWRVSRGRLALAGDAIAAEKRPLEGFQWAYRAGVAWTLPGRTPISLLTSVDLGDRLSLNRWSLGVAMGLQNQLLAVGSALPGNTAGVRLESLNFAAVARGRTGK